MAIKAAIRPKTIRTKVETRPWNKLFVISFTDLPANLHPTDEPTTKRQIFIISLEKLYEAIPVIFKNPVETNEPDNKAAGIFNLSKNKTTTKEQKKSMTNSKWLLDIWQRLTH